MNWYWSISFHADISFFFMVNHPFRFSDNLKTPWIVGWYILTVNPQPPWIFASTAAGREATFLQHYGQQHVQVTVRPFLFFFGNCCVFCFSLEGIGRCHGTSRIHQQTTRDFNGDWPTDIVFFFAGYVFDLQPTTWHGDFSKKLYVHIMGYFMGYMTNNMMFGCAWTWRLAIWTTNWYLAHDDQLWVGGTLCSDKPPWRISGGIGAQRTKWIKATARELQMISMAMIVTEMEIYRRK